MDRLAGDVAGRRRGQEGDGGRHFRRLAVAAHRDRFGHLGHAVARHGGMAVGVLLDEARRHAVHRDARRGEVGRERARQRLHAGLGRGGGREAHQATREGVRHEGRHADHPPAGAGLDQPRLGRRREFEIGGRHRREAGIPGRAIDFADRPAVGEACVADHDVETAEALCRLLDEARADTGLCQIALEDQRLGARLARDCGDLLGTRAILARMHRDRHAGGGERADRRRADTGGRARDQGNARDGNQWRS
jgi:hypothetical protein